jgi:hypothetical protein
LPSRSRWTSCSRRWLATCGRPRRLQASLPGIRQLGLAGMMGDERLYRRVLVMF